MAGGHGAALWAPASPPAAVATAQEDLGDALRIAGRVRAADGVPIEPARAPFLTYSPAGARFLALTPPRALARGEPPAQCPGLGVAQGPDAPAAALRDCLAAVEGRPDCGCRLLAVDHALLAEPEAFAYAPGVGGRLIGMHDAAGPLVVEEGDIGAPGLIRVVFYDAGGPVAAADLGEGGQARLILLESGARFEGVREQRGWRRGRLSERLLLTGEDGARLIALIGFEPADLIAEGAALAAWPIGGVASAARAG